LKWSVRKNQTHLIVIAPTLAAKKEIAVIAFIITGRWGNFLHAIFLQMLNLLVTGVLKILLDCTRNVVHGGSL
jgi:hypothetical protein